MSPAVLTTLDSQLDKINNFAKQHGKQVPMTESSPWGKVKASMKALGLQSTPDSSYDKTYDREAHNSTKDAVKSIWFRGRENVLHLLETIDGKSVKDIVDSVNNPKVDAKGVRSNYPSHEDLEQVNDLLEGVNEYANEHGKSIPMTENSPWGRIREAYNLTKPSKGVG